MIDKRFPQWDVDIEKGTIYSFKHKRNVGTIGRDGYIMINNHNYNHNYVHQYIWMVVNQAEIPEGYDIHHIDGNRLNNSIYNLELIERTKHRSEHKIGKKNNKEPWNKGKKLSEEYKMKISKTLTGFKHTDVTKKKMSELKKGTQLNRVDISKKVSQYTLDGELIKVWDSLMECSRNGFQLGCVSGCCRGIRKTHKGFIWKYYEEQKDVA